jgi:glutathione S-transferase
MTKANIKLYGFKLSGHAHRVELFLSILGLPFEKVEVDLLKGAHKSPEFLARNPLGQVPVLEDGDVTIPDSNAILVYLATKYDASGKWYPRDPIAAARVQRWLSIAAGELQSGPGAARLIVLLGAKLDHEQAKKAARALYDVVEGHLSASPYLAGDIPTIADVALYSYTALAPEGHVSLDGWPNVRAWLERIEKLPGFVPPTRSTVA